MSSFHISRNNEQIEAEASAWFARHDSGSMTAKEQEAFREWLARSPKHREAWTRVAAVWEDLGQFFAVSNDAAPPARQQRVSRVRRGLMVGLAAAAVGAVAIPSALFLSRRDEASGSNWAAQFTTGVGERRRVDFPDGSTAVINTNSRVEAVFRNDMRSLKLIRGEAVFTVAHDARRPFVVEAAGNLVRAIGTAFAVRLRGERVDVAVTEGRVQVSAPSHDGGAQRGVATTAVSAGERVSVDLVSFEVAPVLREVSRRIERDLSWINGFIVFEQDTLATVVDEVSRYTTVDIVIADPALREVRVSGMFEIGQTDALLGALESSFNLRIERVNPNLVYISRP